MPSYKRIYIFEEILYIISPKYCISKNPRNRELETKIPYTIGVV